MLSDNSHLTRNWVVGATSGLMWKIMTGIEQGQPTKLLDQMRAVLRLHHYAIRTERAYCDWVRRYVKFHGMKSRADLAGGKAKVEAFLTHLAVHGKVSPATQNQAFQALLFLYGRVLEQPLEQVDALRAERKTRVPEVLTVEEARSVLAQLKGSPQLVVKLLYGSGLRLMEAVRLRIKDIDFKMLSVTVREGKGGAPGEIIAWRTTATCMCCAL